MLNENVRNFGMWRIIVYGQTELEQECQATDCSRPGPEAIVVRGTVNRAAHPGDLSAEEFGAFYELVRHRQTFSRYHRRPLMGFQLKQKSVLPVHLLLGRCHVLHAMLCIVFALVGCATTTTQTRYGDWQRGEWQGIAESGFSTVTVESTPPGAIVSQDGAPMGRTPAVLHLAYGVEVRMDERPVYEDRTSSGTGPASTLLSLGTLGLWDKPAAVQTSVIDREIKRETRSRSRAYTVRVSLPGYFSRSITVEAPRDEGRTISLSLCPKEILLIAPVTVVEAVQRETGAFRWLKAHIFGRNAIRRDQYTVLAERIGESFRNHFEVSDDFLRITLLTAEMAPPDAQQTALYVRVELGEDTVVLQAEFSSQAVLGSRRLTQRTVIEDKDFLVQLHDICGQLAQAILSDYSAAVANDGLSQGNN